MQRLTAFYKDPLTHFLLAGLVFFLLLNGGAAHTPDENRIVVDRAALLEFIQFRSKAFEPAVAATLLDSMSPDARAGLINDYVQEEVLYREAEALDLEANDYVIKQRMVQKFGFLTEAAVAAASPEDAEIEDWYEAHKDDYAVPSSATFAHVFFSAEGRGMEAAKSEAARMVDKLNSENAAFEDAVQYGERFPFHTNYVERTYDYVASQFGENAATALFDDAGPFNVWRGPIQSEYGAHAVIVRSVTPGRLPSLDDVRARASEDAARAERSALTDKLIAEAVSQYDVVIELEPAQGDASKAAR